MPTDSIPQHLLQDRYWKGLLYFFVNSPKLQRLIDGNLINLNECTVHASKLKKLSAPWSNSERFMLQLALHLYNESNKVNLSDMDYLDPQNKQLALKAIQLRFGL